MLEDGSPAARLRELGCNRNCEADLFRLRSVEQNARTEGYEVCACRMRSMWALWGGARSKGQGNEEDGDVVVMGKKESWWSGDFKAGARFHLRGGSRDRIRSSRQERCAGNLAEHRLGELDDPRA